MINICIVQPQKDAYSETFIHNHKKYLEGNIFVLHGKWFPEYYEDKKIVNLFFSRNVFSRLFYYLLKLLPQFLYTRLPSGLNGIEKGVALQEKVFKFFLKKNKIQLVLAEYGEKGAIVTDVCKSMNIPLVVHFHGQDAHRKDILNDFESGYKRMFANAKALVVVSKKMKEQIIKLGAPFHKIHHIPYGVDLDKFKKSFDERDKNLFISVGRFADTKAPFLTILAFYYAQKELKDIKLHMFGEGPLLESSKNLALALKLEENVTFEGIAAHEKVSEFMSKARAFILHSITTTIGDSEGTPNVILEAASSSLPIISTFHAGIPDVVSHDENGLLVKEKDFMTMADYIVKLAKDDIFAERIGRKARENIERNYNLKQQINKLDALIKEVCAE